MLLAADVGNTNVKLGIFDGDNLKFKLRFSTDENKTSDELAVELFTFLQIYNIDAKNIDGAIISSVVPKFTYNLRSAIMTVTGKKSLLIGPGLKTGLDIKIEHPETLGADIVAGCVGACEKYGGPLIMIFMGTATAIVYVDASNAYHGGAIAPGMGISLDALTNHGALLSSVDMKATAFVRELCSEQPVCLTEWLICLSRNARQNARLLQQAVLLRLQSKTAVTILSLMRILFLTDSKLFTREIKNKDNLIYNLFLNY